MPLWKVMGGTDEETLEPDRAALEQHLDHGDSNDLDRAVVIELGEITARTTVFEPEDDDWVSVGPATEHKLRSRPDVNHRADLAVVADAARVHIEPGLMTDYILSGHDVHNGRVVALFREQLGAERVFAHRQRGTTPPNRLALVGAGIIAALALVGVPIGVVLNSGFGDEASVLGTTTERTEAAAPPATAPPTTAAPTTAPATTAPPATAAPSTAPATTTPPATAPATTALAPIDPECQAIVYDEADGIGQSWTFMAGEHDLLLEPRHMVRSVTVTGSGCHVQACTEWAAEGVCEVIDEGSHNVTPDLADGVSYLRVG